MPYTEKPAHEIHALKKSYADKGDAIARLGRVAVLGTIVTYVLDSTIGTSALTRMEAFAYSAALYTGSHLWLKLSEDFTLASCERQDPKKTLHHHVSKPLEGFGAKVALAAAFGAAYVLGGKAADAEYEAQAFLRRQQLEAASAKHVSPDTIIPDSTGYGIRAGNLCHGQNSSVIFNIGKQLYQVDCQYVDNRQPVSP